MEFEDVIYKRRTIRRFLQRPIEVKLLKQLIDYGRVAPAGNNIQPVEYIIVTSDEQRAALFSMVRWAASLPKEMRTPEEGKRPMAYLIVLVNTKIKKNAQMDVGGAVENILLGAANHGLGTCWMGAIDRKKIQKHFEIPSHYEVSHVISLGYPAEKSTMEPHEDSFKYWKDEEGNMHVPKRSLEDVILKIE